MKVALTGGASGIGAEVAGKLKTLGHHVTAFDISEPSIQVDKWVQTDLSDPASIENALDVADGPFDALVNNAGLPPREGQAALILKVNYFGMRAFYEGMLTKMVQGGSIVNVASRAGAGWRDHLREVKALLEVNVSDVDEFIAVRGMDAVRAYNLSKEAVIVLTMAETERMLELGLRMNSVSPAAVSTGILKDFTAAFGDKVAQNIARVGRAGLPEEIADVIIYLASPESGWIKGQDIVIDGGITAIAVSEALGLN